MILSPKPICGHPQIAKSFEFVNAPLLYQEPTTVLDTACAASGEIEGGAVTYPGQLFVLLLMQCRMCFAQVPSKGDFRLIFIVLYTKAALLMIIFGV